MTYGLLGQTITGGHYTDNTDTASINAYHLQQIQAMRDYHVAQQVHAIEEYNVILLLEDCDDL